MIHLKHLNDLVMSSNNSACHRKHDTEKVNDELWLGRISLHYCDQAKKYNSLSFVTHLLRLIFCDKCIHSTPSRYATENLPDKQKTNFSKMQTLSQEIWEARMVKAAWLWVRSPHILLILQIHFISLVRQHSKRWAFHSLLLWKRYI